MAKKQITPITIAGQSGSDLTLLAVSDLHDHDVEVLADAVRHFAPDIVVFAGDGLHACARNNGNSWLREIADLTSIGVLAVAGNADGPDALAVYGGGKVYDLGKQPVQIGKLRFVGLPGAPIVKGLPRTGLGSPLYRERDAAEYLARCTRGHEGPVVLVSHAPPRGMVDHSWRFLRDIGSIAVRHFILSETENIGLVLCGHVHACGGQQCFAETIPVWNVASRQHDSRVIGICHLRLSQSTPNDLSITQGNPYSALLEWSPAGELALLPGMQGPIAGGLIEGGILTLSDLAASDGQRISQLIGWRPEKASVWAFRAQAFLEKRPIPIAALAIASEPRWFIDIETDPTGGLEFVWAVALASGETGKITQWYLRDLRGHAGMLGAVATFLAQIPVGKLFAYSGSRFDERILANHMRHYGIAVPVSLEHAVDIHAILCRAVALPGTGQLKDVLEGFEIRHRYSDLNGLEAAAQAYRALHQKKPVPSRLLRYNREDVRTLRELVPAVIALSGITEPRPRRAGPSGAAARKAEDDKKVLQLLASREMTIRDLARLCPFLRSRIRKGRRITSLAVELAFEQIDTLTPRVAE